ncbi:MAG: reprolysin-like metallopeptidase [Aquihabitans sp.]
MKVHKIGPRSVAALLAALVAFATLAVPSVQAQEPSPPDSSSSGASALLSPPDAARSSLGDESSRAVDVDASVLVPDTPVTIDVDVFSNARFTVDLEPFDSGAPGWDAWTGPVEGVDDGTATFIRRGDEVSGVVSTPDGTFRVQRRGDGNVARKTSEDLAARQTEPDYLIPPEGEQGMPPAGHRPESDRGIGAAPAANRVVDVLVAYTPQARIEMGGKAAIEAEAALSIAATNTAYIDSGVNGAVRMVGVVETSFNIALSEAGIIQLTDPSDGKADELPVKRDQLGADLVALLSGTSADLCGLGWYLDTMAGTPEYGYSVIAHDCAVDLMAFAHELGHNMGLDHDRYVSPNLSTFLPYAYGYVDVAGGWQTIMAYDTKCLALLGTYCTALPRFSNPDQLRGGRPLGRPAGTTDAADNRKALNLTIPVVAGYRTANDTPKLGYASITPCRVVDTRSAGGMFSPGATRTFQVAGGGAVFVGQGGRPGGCNVPADASAVEATITAVGPGAGGFARVYPAGTAMPGATFINYVRGQSIGNTGTIPIATTGSNADLTLSNFGGTTHYVIDIQGYFSAAAPLGYVPVKPCRVVDTRYVGYLNPGDTETYQVAGSGELFWDQGGASDGCSVPLTARAVEATITAVDPYGHGYARVYPVGTAMPGATFINYVDRKSIGNTGTIPIATTASTADLAIKNYSGYVDYVVDIQGFYAPR